ncbi:hypothetical protein C8R43DRAFT_1105397 [Mycena crocata]|nr:hypothetical protein C8R43DRAFT_1105397 [Mycena crocata]
MSKLLITKSSKGKAPLTESGNVVNNEMLSRVAVSQSVIVELGASAPAKDVPVRGLGRTKTCLDLAHPQAPDKGFEIQRAQPLVRTDTISTDDGYATCTIISVHFADTTGRETKLTASALELHNAATPKVVSKESSLLATEEGTDVGDIDTQSLVSTELDLDALFLDEQNKASGSLPGFGIKPREITFSGSTEFADRNTTRLFDQESASHIPPKGKHLYTPQIVHRTPSAETDEDEEELAIDPVPVAGPSTGRTHEHLLRSTTKHARDAADEAGDGQPATKRRRETTPIHVVLSCKVKPVVGLRSCLKGGRKRAAQSEQGENVDFTVKRSWIRGNCAENLGKFGPADLQIPLSDRERVPDIDIEQPSGIRQGTAVILESIRAVELTKFSP